MNGYRCVCVFVCVFIYVHFVCVHARSFVCMLICVFGSGNGFGWEGVYRYMIWICVLACACMCRMEWICSDLEDLESLQMGLKIVFSLGMDLKYFWTCYSNKEFQNGLWYRSYLGSRTIDRIKRHPKW